MSRNDRQVRRKFLRVRPFLALALIIGALSGCQPPTSSIQSGSASRVSLDSTRAKVIHEPVKGGPIVLYEGITLRKIINVEPASIKLARSPLDNALYILNPAKGLYRLDVQSAALFNVAATAEIVEDAVPSGMAFGPDGTLYVVANRNAKNNLTQAIIRKGVANTLGRFSWQTFAMTEPYPMSNTYFDHLFNGIVVSADGQSVFVNSGSRTDHGEIQDSKGAFPNTREVPLTAKIFRISTSTDEQLLPNDEAALTQQDVVFAEGIRNAYDLTFAPNGDLFAVDNGPDADYPDELNWIREGHHYGFPWRFGDQDNPQQFPDYDSSKDVRLPANFAAVESGTYQNDPNFPKPPGTFTNPVANLGPDATHYRGDDGKEHRAVEEGKPLYTFTPHRSPLGLVFAADEQMPTDLRSDGDSLSAFVLSWGAAGGTFSEKGQDLLYLRLKKQGDQYESITTQLARGFSNPIDAVLIENRLYVLEYGQNSAVWELTFE